MAGTLLHSFFLCNDTKIILNRSKQTGGNDILRGDRDRNTMSPRREVPTMHWQAIVAHTLVILQQGKEVAFVWQYGCRSDHAERQCTGKQMRIPPFLLLPFLNVPYLRGGVSGPEKGVITKGVFSLEESLESLKSLESLENGRILSYFPESGDSLKSLESLNSLESQENGFFRNFKIGNEKGT